jgi:hypothetical protein
MRYDLFLSKRGAKLGGKIVTNKYGKNFFRKTQIPKRSWQVFDIKRNDGLRFPVDEG